MLKMAKLKLVPLGQYGDSENGVNNNDGLGSSGNGNINCNNGCTTARVRAFSGAQATTGWLG